MFCEPLDPATVNVYGLGVEALNPLAVTVVDCPTKMVAGLNVHVTPLEQTKEMFPPKPLGPDAVIV